MLARPFLPVGSADHRASPISANVSPAAIIERQWLRNLETWYVDQRGREFIHVVGHLPHSPRKPRPSKSALTLFSKLHAEALEALDVELDDDTVRLLTAFHVHTCLRHRFKSWRLADTRRRAQALRMCYALEERHHRALKRRWRRFVSRVSLRRGMVLGATHCTARRLRSACGRWFQNVRLIKSDVLRRSLLRSRLSTVARRSRRLCLTAWRAHLQRREVQALGRNLQSKRAHRAGTNALRAALQARRPPQLRLRTPNKTGNEHFNGIEITKLF